MRLRLGHHGPIHEKLEVLPGLGLGPVVVGRVPAPLIEVEPADVEPPPIEDRELLVVGGRMEPGQVPTARMDLAPGVRSEQVRKARHVPQGGRSGPRLLGVEPARRSAKAGLDLRPDGCPRQGASHGRVHGRDGPERRRVRSRGFGRGPKAPKRGPGAAVKGGPRHGVEVGQDQVDRHAAPQGVREEVEPGVAHAARLRAAEPRERVEDAERPPDLGPRFQNGALEGRIGLRRGQEDFGGGALARKARDMLHGFLSARLRQRSGAEGGSGNSAAVPLLGALKGAQHELHAKHESPVLDLGAHLAA